jgi:broad specificity phosphatase PhoE
MRKIILLRHGEVNIKNYKNISANQFGKWIEEYNNSEIKPKIIKDDIQNIFNQADIIICSGLKRSIQSVEIFDQIPSSTEDIFNEAQLPYANWNLLKLHPKVWLVLFRILWFFGYSPNCESFKQAKQRTKQATQRLVELSKSNQTIVLIGHGIMNRLIAKELVLENWDNTKKLGNNNWEYGVFQYHNYKDVI